MLIIWPSHDHMNITGTSYDPHRHVEKCANSELHLWVHGEPRDSWCVWVCRNTWANEMHIQNTQLSWPPLSCKVPPFPCPCSQSTIPSPCPAACLGMLQWHSSGGGRTHGRCAGERGTPGPQGTWFHLHQEKVSHSVCGRAACPQTSAGGLAPSCPHTTRRMSRE